MIKYVIVLTLYLVSPEQPNKIATMEIHGDNQCARVTAGECVPDPVLEFEYQTLLHCQIAAQSEALKSYVIEKYIGGDVQFIELYCKPLTQKDAEFSA